MVKPELLSPCGDYNCFISAVNAGADAVYLSSNKFGARAYAKNFTEEELIQAIDYAHIFGVKVYMTVNTLFKENEMTELYEHILPFYLAGLDGVIVQDLGVVKYLSEHFYGLPIHASTQMAITGKEGVEALKKLGIVRVVLARELSMQEINKIYKETGMELECFVHGSLCYSYSGKCLFSSLIGGRSGNRGRCAGPCRQPYNNDSYLLSTKDICCLRLIPKLCDGSIASFKIEGRMKSPEYVSAVTGIYRKYIDLYFNLLEKYGENNREKAEEAFINNKEIIKDEKRLVDLYSRSGNSQGYYYKHNGADMVSLNSGSYNTDKNSKNEIEFESESNGSIEDLYIAERKIPLYGYISLIPGSKAMLTVSTEDVSVVVYGAEVEESVNRPLTEDTVLKQLNKTGNTAYIFDNIDVEVSDSSFMRVSELNELRRNAFDLITEEIISKYRRNNPGSNCDSVVSGEKNDNKYITCESSNGDIIVNIEISNDMQLEKALEINEVDGIYIPWSIISNIGNTKYKNIVTLLDIFKKVSKKFFVKLPTVIRYDFFEENSSLLELLIDISNGFLVDNLESLYYLKSMEYRGDIYGDIHIYRLNSLAKKQLQEMGFSGFTVPVELNKSELIHLDNSSDELIVYGRLPMIVSAQCVNKTINKCNKTQTDIYIEDRTKAKFLCINDCSSCINTIYNSVPLMLFSDNEEITKISPKSYRYIFVDETPEQMEQIITGNCEITKYTRGHFNRGVQ